MFCFGSKKSSADAAKARRDAEIDKQIKSDQRKASREIKILLLGAGESGKSTVLKQMRLIHKGGFPIGERKQWRATIFSNLVTAFQCLQVALEEHDVKLVEPESQQYIDMFKKDHDIGLEEPMPKEFQKPMQELWKDKGIQKVMERGHEYALHDNLSYYITQLDTLFASDYIPTDQDIFRARLRTTGITETIFETSGLTFRMFDVGGQRSERKKWIHVFDNVQVVLFLVALSGYDHALLEDRRGNQMREAIMLFQSIGNSKYFVNAGLVLFLNKMDLFKTKVESKSANIREHFPEYEGPEGDVDAASKFFAARFKRTMKNQDKEVYTHYTNATDTTLLDKTMKSVQDMIVQKNMNALML